MEIRVLGPITVVDDGDSVALGGPRQQAVLAVLVAFANQLVSTDRLIDEIWGEEPPPAARNSLQSMVSNLRRILSPDDAISIEREGPGYVLRCPADRIDAVRFAAAIDEARAVLGTDPVAAASLLEAAVTSRRGTAYVGLADDVPALHTEQVRLEELYLRALAYRIEADLETGRHGEVVGELDGLVDAHPLNEEFARLQMLALYRSGRQSDALRAMARLRRVLGEELGIDPSPDLREIEQRILDQDPALLVAGDPYERRTDLPNPFKGLSAFGEGDSDDFFGRDALVSEVVERVLEHPVTALVGPSGSGKSSVVGAGALPALRLAEPGWVIATMFPGSRPHEELEAALLRAVPEAPAALPTVLAGDGGLRRAVNTLAADGERVVLVIDQAEELFALADDAARDAFVESLQDGVAAGRLRILMTLRSDFLGEALSHPGLADLVRSGTVLVPPMGASELEEAIVGPARRVGAAVDDAFVAAAMADLRGRPGALPMLQHALTEAFERREHDVMQASDYQAVGGVSQALANTASDVLAGLPPGHLGVVQSVFLGLVVPGDGSSDTRRRMPRRDLDSLGLESESVTAVIDAFVEARLIVLDVDPASSESTIEVAHESLFTEWPDLRLWIDETRDDLRVSVRLRALADEWDGAGRSEGLLLRGDHLARFTSWRDTTELTVDAVSLAFLADGETVEQHAELAAARRRRRVVTAISAAAVVSLAFAVLAAYLGLQASESARLARSRAVAGQAISLIGDNQDLSVLLAIEAVEIEPTPESLEALHRTVGEHRLVATFAATGLSAAWVDERRVAALQADGSVHIVEARTGDQEAALGPVAGSAAALGAITSPELSVSHDGRLLGAALPDGTFDVWSIETGERLWTIRVGELTPSVAWHPAEPLVAVRGLDRRFAEIASPEPFQTGAAEGAILDALSGDVVEELPSCFCPAEVSFDGLGRLWLQADSEGLRPSATLSAFVEVGPGAWGRSGDLRISAPLAEQSAASLNRVVVSAGTTARASTFSGTIVASFSGHGADIRDIAVYDELAASGSEDGRVMVWSTVTGEEEMALTGHNGVVLDVDFAPKGSQLVSVAADGVARVWDTSSGATVEVERFTVLHNSRARYGEFVDGGRGLIVGVADPLLSRSADLFELRALDAGIAVFAERSDAVGAAGRPLDRPLDFPALWVFFQSFDADPETSAFTGAAGFYEGILFTSGGFEILKSTEFEFQEVIPGAVVLPTGPPLATALSENADVVAIAGCGDVDGAGCVGDAYLLVAPFVSELPDLDNANSLGIGAGNPIAVGISDGVVAALLVARPSTADSAEVVVWDPSTGLSRRWAVAPDATTLAFHGEVVVVGDARGQLTFYDIEGDVTSASGAHVAGVSALAIDRQRSLLVSAGRGGRVSVWDLLDGENLYAIHTDTPAVLDVSLDPARQEVAVAMADGAVEILTYDIDRLMDIARSRVTRELTDAECERYLQGACP